MGGDAGSGAASTSSMLGFPSTSSMLFYSVHVYSTSSMLGSASTSFLFFFFNLLCFRVSRDSWSSTDAKSCGKTSLQHRWLQQHVRLCQSELKIIFDNFTTILLFCLCFVLTRPNDQVPVHTSANRNLNG